MRSINISSNGSSGTPAIGSHAPWSGVKHFQDWQSLRENETSALCRDVQFCSVGAGTAFAKRRGMLAFFMAGPDLVRWELQAVERDGPFRLTIHHRQGVIVEYFSTTVAALNRERQLEQLLIAARGNQQTAAEEAVL